jgi:hypothetical protein
MSQAVASFLSGSKIMQAHASGFFNRPFSHIPGFLRDASLPFSPPAQLKDPLIHFHRMRNKHPQLEL